MSSYSVSPRPILKRSVTAGPSSKPSVGGNDRINRCHVVHFPPSPTLTRTFSAHSPSQYDRSPIVVAPNMCALPERGCPGRTYTTEDSENVIDLPQFSPPQRQSHKHMHPRAAFQAPKSTLGLYSAPAYEKPHIEHIEEAERTPTNAFPMLPSLIPDLSESDESDGTASSPPEPFSGTYSGPFRIRKHDAADLPPLAALSYLPYPHPPSNDASRGREVEAQKAHRHSRRKSKERTVVVDGADDASDPFARSAGSYKCLSMCKALSTCTLEDADDGALAGF